ncbi:hypothetical protein CVCC1112_2278 [Paenarthrobacter nicotinovorans]|nr:hypothetical protein ANMWB30_37990 [Arthrobacter sp. MWB30]GAT87619.1 hypothetical protein CVCC1112_2278 [Paenarthrobacter nicotinovorans]
MRKFSVATCHWSIVSCCGRGTFPRFLYDPAKGQRSGVSGRKCGVSHSGSPQKRRAGRPT